MAKKKHYHSEKKSDIIQMVSIVGSNLIIMITFFGIAVSLHLSSREDIRAIQAEIKDFHEKLIKLEMNR